MRFVCSALIWLTALPFTLKASAQEVANQKEVLEMLAKASEANRSLLHFGRVSASVRHCYYDEKGQKNKERAYEVRALFKKGKIRLDIKDKKQRKESEKIHKVVVTEESFKEYFTGERDAYLRGPKMVGTVYGSCGFLPSRNTAFWHTMLDHPEGTLASRKIIRENASDSKVYTLECVSKKRPKSLQRYFVDPTEGGTVVKFESYHDFGNGHVLLRRDEAEMQPTREGACYLERFKSTNYKPDGTLRRIQEIEIKSFDFTFSVLDAEFTWEAMALPKGTTIHDKRLGIYYTYGAPPEQSRKGTESNEKNQTQQEMPRHVKMLLEGIRAGKSNRDRWRSLYKLVNKPAPKLAVATWINSKPLRLSDLRGKIVVLDFWAIDCGPCLGDIEGLNKIHERGQYEPVIVIGVHTPIDDISEVERVMARHKVKYPVCIDTNGASRTYFGGCTFEKYAVSAIPRPFLIDIKGKIRSVSSPVNPWELDELIKESADGVTGISPAEPEWLFGVKVAPESVSFEGIIKGQKTEKSVHIYKPDDPDFKVDITMAPDKAVEAKLLRYEQEGTLLYELRILHTTDFEGEIYSSQVKLKTNDPNSPEIVIPIKAVRSSG